MESPVNAGLLGVQPSLQWELRLLALLQQTTFSEVDGWGGPYAEELLDVLRGYRKRDYDLDCLPRHASPASIQTIIAKRQARYTPRGRLRGMPAKPSRGASMALR